MSKYQGVQLLDRMVGVCFICKKLPNCLPRWLYHFALFSAVNENSCSFTSSPTFGVLGWFFFFKFIYLFLGLRWVFVAAGGLCLAVASGGYSSLRWCAGFSLRWLLVLQTTGSRRAGFSSCGLQALECTLSSCGARA